MAHDWCGWLGGVLEAALVDAVPEAPEVPAPVSAKAADPGAPEVPGLEAPEVPASVGVEQAAPEVPAVIAPGVPGVGVCEEGTSVALVDIDADRGLSG